MTGGGCSAQTATTTVSITAAITGNTGIKAGATCSGSGIILTPSGTPAGGDGTFTYYWQSQGNCGSGNGWNDRSVGPEWIVPDAFKSHCFRAVIVSGGCTVLSNEEVLPYHQIQLILETV